MPDDTRLCKGFSCYWRIENFDIFLSNGKSILKSHTFGNISLKDSEWHFEIYKQADGNLDIGIVMDKGNTVTLNISLLYKTYDWSTIENNTKYEFKKDHNIFEVKHFVSLQKIEQKKDIFLPDNSLTVCFVLSIEGKKKISSQCLLMSKMIDGKDISNYDIKEFLTLKLSDFIKFHISYITQLPDKIIHGKVIQLETAEDGGMEDIFRSLLGFFKKKEFCDVTIRTSSKDFAVHKVIISASSPVFRDKLKRNTDDILLINDIDCETVSLMLKFLYFEHLENLDWDKAKSLFYAANIYQIPRLKIKCVSFLKAGLSCKTVYEALTFAKSYQIEDLKCSAEEFFCNNITQIFKSPEWNNFLLKDTQSAANILRDLADKLSIKGQK